MRRCRGAAKKRRVSNLAAVVPAQGRGRDKKIDESQTSQRMRQRRRGEKTEMGFKLHSG